MDIGCEAAYAIWPCPELSAELAENRAAPIFSPITNPFEYPVSDLLAIYRDRPEGVTIPTFWIALALSLLLHLAVMWQWLPKLHLPSPDEMKLGEANGSLVVSLAPPPSAPPSPEPEVLQPAPKLEARPPIGVARPRPAPPVIAFSKPPPNIQTPPTVPVRPPADGDLSAYIEAQRRARAQSAGNVSAGSAPTVQPAEDDKARSNRIVAANLGAQRAQTFGYDPRTQGGGVFQIVRMGYDDTEFTFFGWNKEIRRNTKQQIEVRRGNNSDIRLAVVRRMISIIRDYEQEDFLWESHRLGRSLTLSARARDNAGLEEFMLREFFVNPRVPQ